LVHQDSPGDVEAWGLDNVRFTLSNELDQAARRRKIATRAAPARVMAALTMIAMWIVETEAEAVTDDR
jgi:hypothetical protein